MAPTTTKSQRRRERKRRIQAEAEQTGKLLQERAAQNAPQIAEPPALDAITTTPSVSPFTQFAAIAEILAPRTPPSPLAKAWKAVTDDPQIVIAR
jgi:hypothetical protein